MGALAHRCIGDVLFDWTTLNVNERPSVYNVVWSIPRKSEHDVGKRFCRSLPEYALE